MQMKKIGILLLVAFTSFASAIERENSNGPSFYLGIGDVFGIIGINAQYQIEFNNSHFSISPFLGAGASGSVTKWFCYSGGIFGEYGKYNKIQIGTFYRSWGNVENAFGATLGYHLVATSGFSLFANVGIKFVPLNSGTSNLPTANLGFGYKI